MADFSQKGPATTLPFPSAGKPSSFGITLPRWALLVAGGTLLALLIAVIVGVILHVRANRKLDAARTTLDATLAAHLYQTYLSLSMLADGAEADAYNDDDRHRLLDTVIGLLDSVDLQMKRIAESGLKAEGNTSLERCQQLSKVLRSQAGELRAYWRTSEKERATRFQQLREEAWTIIREIVEIEG